LEFLLQIKFKDQLNKIIHFSLPNLNSRIEIYEIHTQNLHLDDDVSLKELAELSNNFTGADIKVVCQFATINAAKRTIPDIGSENKEISDEGIEEIVINKQDFLVTIKEITERINSMPQ